MNREQVMQEARTVGLVVEPCNDENFIAIRASEVSPGITERMRITSDGACLTVADGYYWQVGTVEDVANYVETLKAREQ